MSTIPSSPGGGLNLKSLPPWAWALAIVGGTVVGFVLLKPGTGRGEEGREEPTATSSSKPRAGETAVVEPLIPKSELEALGLSPGAYQYAS